MAENESLTRAQEALTRARKLASAYGIYRGVKYRAIIQHREGRTDAPWVHLLGSLRYCDSEITKERWQTSELTAEGLVLLTADLPLDVEERVLAPILKTGVYETYPGQQLVIPPSPKLSVSMASPAATPSSIGLPQELDRVAFERFYGEPHPGVLYFLDSHLSLENELRMRPATVAELGFYTTQEFLWRSALNPHGTIAQAPSVSQSGLHVIMPNYHAQLLSATIEGEQIVVMVKTAGSAPIEHFNLAVRATVANGGTLPPARAEALKDAKVVLSFPQPPAYARIRLSWNPGSTDAERYVDERSGDRAELVLYPGLVAYHQTDSKLSRLETNASGDGPNPSDDFEWSLATMLSIAGFVVQWPGYLHGKSGKEVDILAFLTHKRELFVIECTLALGDIQKKIQRVSEMATDLANVFEGWDIWKAVATTLRSTNVNPSDTQDASRLGIALLPKERVAELLKAVRSAVPADEIASAFLKQSPSAWGL